ncbi:MAG TPA: hypothetical protein PLE75_00095 [Ferruginibacter sp.]|nr:hypothetical protein [Ferruginibacter sp.]HRO05055.1 hypothetical protein [Ferruginibacter sp.]HRO95640.1 hypothetical protein [Ferruginibacter sp.]HRP49501.1 hypothetical protein [Ferruginibacter sp.]
MMIRKTAAFLLLLCCMHSGQTIAQNSGAADSFFNQLKVHCGRSYEGRIISGGRDGDGFTGERLVMQVLSCKENTVKIPFYVGNNRSRTWVFTRNNHRISLKHIHRHEDGSNDAITLYGGTASNSGTSSLQFFPADAYTCNLLPAACTNVWWVTVSDTSFTYNLRRVGSERVFSVLFDLTRPVEMKGTPWGWKEDE